MKETVTIISRICNSLKAHKWILIGAGPVVLVGVYALLLLVPNKYTCRVGVLMESQRTVERERSITLNSPENYDLGFYRTDNIITRQAYNELITSPDVLFAICDKEVSTLDGSYKGTLADYIYPKKEVKNLEEPKVEVINSPYQYRLVKKLRQCIEVSVDQNSDVVSINVTTKDPLVSAQMATYIEAEMKRTLLKYEQDKMQAVLNQLVELTNQAEKDWQAAKQNGNAQADLRKQVYESFARQQVIYAAQMAAIPSSTYTITKPMIDYSKSAPHRTVIAVLMTLLVEMGLGVWYCRREIIELL